LPRAARARIIAVMRGTVLICCVATLLPAQDPPAPKGPVRVDAVIATVNDGAITLSELRNVAEGFIRRKSAQRPLSAAEIETIYLQQLRLLIDKHRLAQAVKSFGVFTPEQIEMIFQRELTRQEQEQLRDFGSYRAIANELKRQGQTWGTAQSEKRVDIMSRFATDIAVAMRLQKQSNLYLTPRMLRETYERERHFFVHGTMARVSIVVFLDNGARAKAEKAAAEWREQEIDASQLAARYGAIALSEKEADELAPELAAIKTFALAGPVGNISPPFEADGAVRIAKITAYVAERNGRFEDPAVQDELRARCGETVRDEFMNEALKRAGMRTEVWQSVLYFGGGRAPQK
jgi:hypothetical protein